MSFPTERSEREALLDTYRRQALDTLRAAYSRGEISVNVVRSVFPIIDGGAPAELPS